MPENILNSNNEEVVHPQLENSNNEEVVHPRNNELTPDDIKNMSNDEFNDYLNSNDESGLDATDTKSEKIDDNNQVDETEDGKSEDESAQEKADKPDKVEPYRTFMSEEEYNDEVGKRINAAIRNRMRKHNEQADKYAKLNEMASVYYPDADDPVSVLTSDIPVEDYRKQMEDKIDAERYRKLKNEDAERERRREEIINGWQRDAEQIRYINPEFDFDKAIKNPEFADMLRMGKTVFEAYSKTQHPTPPKQPERKAIIQNGASNNSGTGNLSESNPANLPEADFRKFIEKCRKERIE